MTIYIENLKFSCILGILDFERVTPQDVILNLNITYNYEKEFINYAEVTELLKKEMINNKFLLIEDALLKISAKLKENFPLIQTLYIKITKPSILPDTTVSVSETYNFIS